MVDATILSAEICKVSLMMHVSKAPLHVIHLHSWHLLVEWESVYMKAKCLLCCVQIASYTIQVDTVSA